MTSAQQGDIHDYDFGTPSSGPNFRADDRPW